MPKITLHQWEVSPFCGKIRKILALKGLHYEIVDYGGLRARRAAKLSITGKLPVLDYDNERIHDSTDIAKFLERLHPNPALYPSDVVERSLAMILEDWADESLYWYEVFLRAEFPEAFHDTVALLCKQRPKWERGIFGFILRRLLRKKLHGQGFGQQAPDAVISHLMEILESLDTMLQTNEWLIGSSISIADISVSAQIDEMMRTSHLASRIAKFGKVAAWLKQCAIT